MSACVHMQGGGDCFCSAFSFEPATRLKFKTMKFQVYEIHFLVGRCGNALCLARSVDLCISTVHKFYPFPPSTKRTQVTPGGCGSTQAGLWPLWGGDWPLGARAGPLVWHASGTRTQLGEITVTSTGLARAQSLSQRVI